MAQTRARRRGVIAALGAVAAAVAAAPAAAAAVRLPADASNLAATGKVASAPSGETFTITTRSGATVTVDVSAATTFVEHGVSAPSLADVTTGAIVAIFGSTAGTTVSATQIDIYRQRAERQTPAAAGKVTSAPSGDAFTITTRSGSSITVDVTATTTYAERGIVSATLGDVQSGDLVAVFGTLSGSTVTATEVAIARARADERSGAVGTVATTPANGTFTVTTRGGATVTVDVTATTTYVDHAVADPTLTNVTVGERVGVFGTWSGTTITASEVVIASMQTIVPRVVAGKVATAPSGDAFTITTLSGTTVTVEVTSATGYADLAVASPSLADVTSGEEVAVFGTLAGSTLTATEVMVVGRPSLSSPVSGHHPHGGPISAPSL